MKALFQWLRKPMNGIVARSVFAPILGVSVFLAIYFTRTEDPFRAVNSCFIPGVILIGFSLFSLIIKTGFFDFASYGITSAFYALRKGEEKAYEDLVDYKEKKKVIRKENTYTFLPYLLTGIVFLMVSLILYFC